MARYLIWEASSVTDMLFERDLVREALCLRKRFRNEDKLQKDPVRRQTRVQDRAYLLTTGISPLIARSPWDRKYALLARTSCGSRRTKKPQYIARPQSFTMIKNSRQTYIPC